MTGSETDEPFALKASLIVMIIVAVTMLALRFLINRPIFTPEFEASLVYVPTLVLLGAWYSERSKAAASVG